MLTDLGNGNCQFTAVRAIVPGRLTVQGLRGLPGVLVVVDRDSDMIHKTTVNRGQRVSMTRRQPVPTNTFDDEEEN